ncbi:hypothetical protein APHAL10511_004703 [Amanita phalloides]|nr:hypothetical protein APHAL10511_004703 [Amanita phalloides]
MAPATNFIKSTPRVVANEDEQEDDYEMVSVTVIPPGTEVFNTYGETLTNAQLLTQYGFILDANENDVLTWDIEQVLESISPGADERMLVHDVSNIVLTWRRLCQKNWNLASGSGLLYMADTETGWGYSLTLDGDGKISYPLWIIVALLSLSRTDAFSSVEDSQSVLIHLRSLLDVQCLAESHLGTEEELEDIAINLNIYERTLLQELKQVCQLMIRLCTDRKSKTGHIGFSAMGSDVGKYFDALSDDRPRTKMALSIVLSELSILNNCQATWSELEHIIVRA